MDYYLKVILFISLVIILFIITYRNVENFTSLNDYEEKNNLYICYKNKNIPKFIIPNWKKLNPNLKIHFYDNNDCINFLRNEYGEEYVEIFNFLKDGPIKSDFWRCCILYKRGGWYADIDIKPIKSLESIYIKDVEFISVKSYFGKSQMTPELIYSKKCNKLLKLCIDKIKRLKNNNTKYSYWTYSIVTIMTGEIKKILDNITTKNNIYYDKEGKKYKILFELIDRNNKYNDRVIDNGEIVLYNRYKEYKDHKFQ